MDDIQPTEPPTGERLLTVSELCTRLGGISAQKLHRLCAKGLPYLQISRSAADRLFFWGQVQAWLQSRVRNSVPTHPSTAKRRAIKNRQPGFDQGGQQAPRGSRAAAG